MKPDHAAAATKHSMGDIALGLNVEVSLPQLIVDHFDLVFSEEDGIFALALIIEDSSGFELGSFHVDEEFKGPRCRLLLLPRNLDEDISVYAKTIVQLLLRHQGIVWSWKVVLTTHSTSVPTVCTQGTGILSLTAIRDWHVFLTRL